VEEKADSCDFSEAGKRHLGIGLALPPAFSWVIHHPSFLAVYACSSFAKGSRKGAGSE